MIKAEDKELETASSSCECWGIGFAGVVVVAVIAEFVVDFMKPPYSLFLTESGITGALVALGIVGEIGLGTIWNNRIQAELRKRLNMTLTDALDRAARAETELREFRRPRRDIFAPHRATFVASVSAFSGTPFDAAIDRGGEVMHFWWDLGHALADAGWSHIDWIDNSGMGSRQAPMPISGIGSGTNVEIHIHPQSRASLAPAAAALIAALTAAGIIASDEGFNLHTQNVRAVHIVIGVKG